MTFRSLSVFALALCCAVGCAGQLMPSNPPPATGQAVPPPQVTGSLSGASFRVVDGVTHTVTISMKNPPPMPLWGTVLTGAPYSAEEFEERVRTLADGSRLIEKHLISRTYRDSAGRVRREVSFPQGVDPYSQPAAGLIEIQDPAANVRYRLETRTGIARRYNMSKIPSPETMIQAPLGISSGENLPPTPTPHSMPAGYRPTAPATPPARPPSLARVAAAPPNMPTSRSERLGTQVIVGLMVEGTRMTRVYPTGTDGSDRPIVTVSEQWSSPDLRVTVLSKTNDPRMGETTRRLINLSRAEPDISLFQPPPEYRVVDEQVSFTINHQVSP